jgi:anti-sigma factor RsiW
MGSHISREIDRLLSGNLTAEEQARVDKFIAEQDAAYAKLTPEKRTADEAIRNRVFAVLDSDDHLKPDSDYVKLARQRREEFKNSRNLQPAT